MWHKMHLSQVKNMFCESDLFYPNGIFVCCLFVLFPSPDFILLLTVLFHFFRFPVLHSHSVALLPHYPASCPIPSVKWTLSPSSIFLTASYIALLLNFFPMKLTILYIFLPSPPSPIIPSHLFLSWCCDLLRGGTFSYTRLTAMMISMVPAYFNHIIIM